MKNYTQPRVKIYSVSAGRMVCGSDPVLGINSCDANEGASAWGKGENEDLDW